MSGVRASIKRTHDNRATKKQHNYGAYQELKVCPLLRQIFKHTWV